MLLTATTAKLQIILAAAVASAQAQICASYADMTSTAHTPGSQQSTSNSTTAADIVAAPASSTQRKVTMLSVYNADTAPVTATIRRNDNTTITNLVTVIIPAGYSLFYSDIDGWRLGVTSAQGAPGADGVQLSNTSPWTKNQYIADTSLTDGATVAVDATLGNFRLAMDHTTSTRALSNPSGLASGMVLNFTLVQDSTGGAAITFGTKYKWIGGVPTWSTAANAVSMFSAKYDATLDILICNGGSVS